MKRIYKGIIGAGLLASAAVLGREVYVSLGGGEIKDKSPVIQEYRKVSSDVTSLRAQLDRSPTIRDLVDPFRIEANKENYETLVAKETRLQKIRESPGFKENTMSGNEAAQYMVISVAAMAAGVGGLALLLTAATKKNIFSNTQ